MNRVNTRGIILLKRWAEQMNGVTVVTTQDGGCVRYCGGVVKQKRLAEQMRRVALVTTQDGAENDGNRKLERVIILLVAIQKCL